MKYLVEHGAIIDLDNNLAYVYAAKGGHLDVIKYLVTKGLDLKYNGEAAFEEASKNNHQDVVAYLKSKGVVNLGIIDRFKYWLDPKD